ncbi:MAG: IS3 family transposase [Eubacterium sp.]
MLKYFIDEIHNYIIRYNTKHIKQSLGFMNPVEYRHI